MSKDVAQCLGYKDAFDALKKHVGEADKQNCQNDSFETPRGFFMKSNTTSPPDTKLQVFANPEFGEIRSALIDGEPWLVGKDVAKALGYKEPSKAAREKVDPEDRGGGVQNRHPLRNPDNDRHQRVRPVLSGSFQQAA